MANSLRNWLAGIGLSVGAVTGAVYVADTEGYSATAYYDVAQKLTVCRGHTGSDIIQDKVYTRAECDQLFARDIKAADDALLRLTNPVKLTNGEHAAYLSFIFNVGQSAFAGSTLRKKLLAGDALGACDELIKACGRYGCHGWVYSYDIKWPGLVTRRNEEHAMCISELPASVFPPATDRRASPWIQ
ncbi:lysozyme [Shewanella algae]|uniref:lysozyme n=1 Tax=Shewanella algae TaxID=38313 RepID=UPI000F421903|nr:lysozyme [Shewanella algae]AYV14345.1 lysozyme [Shewanella algae]